MTDLRKAAEMALAGLKQSIGLHIRNDEELAPIIESLEAALAQGEQPEIKQGWDVDTLLDKQEPVAWVKEGKVRVGFGRIEERKYVQFDQTLPVGTKLYTAPVSKREWVSLTDERIAEIVREAAKGSAINRDGSTSHRVARAIEAASKELNHG